MLFCENAICFSCLTEVATGNLLDLAEGAPMALVHSGKTQNTSDPFVVHNHTTENNNTVWVRLESAPREGLPRSDKAGMKGWKTAAVFAVRAPTCCAQSSMIDAQ